MAGEPTGILAAYAVAFLMILLFGLWAISGLRRAEAAG
jgi:hypothetical protein